jgi:predicted Zn-dependent protease
VARGVFVLFLDADDILLPEALATQYAIAARRNVDAVRTIGEVWYGGARTRRSLGERLVFLPYVVLEEADRGGAESQLRVYKWSEPTGCFLYRREVLSRHAIEFDEGLVFGEDSDFASRALRRCGSAAVAPLVTFLYRKGHNSASYANFSAHQWRSFGEHQRNVGQDSAYPADYRAAFGLHHLAHNAERLSALRQRAPLQQALDVATDIATAYRGADPALFARTASQPGDVPVENDPCLRPLFHALVGQDAVAAVQCIDELSLTVFRSDLAEASLLRYGGREEDADKLILAAYEEQPSHPELALEYGKVLLRGKDKQANALDVFSYAYSHSVRLFEPTAVLASTLTDAGRHPAAIGVVRHSLARMPHSPGLFDLLADCCKAAGEAENRVSALAQACKHAPKDAFRRERWLSGLLETSQEKRAREEIDDFAPRMGEAWRERMLALVERKTGALAAARRRIAGVVEQTSKCDLLALSLQADILLDIGDDAAAIPALVIAAYHEQNDTTLRLKLATAFYKVGHFDKAYGVLKEIADTASQEVDELFVSLAGKLNAADAAAFLQARKIRLASVLSRLLKTRKDSPEAGALAPGIGDLLQTEVLNNPKSLPWRLRQIEFLLWQKDAASALQMAQVLPEAFPEDARSHKVLARCLAANARFVDAAEAGRAACRLAPEDEGFARQTEKWAMRGVASARSGRTRVDAK